MKKDMNATELHERLDALEKNFNAPKSRLQVFGENLEHIRKSKGYSRKQIAELVGMHEVAYGAYENGLRQPPLEKVFALADSLKVSVSALFGEDEKTTEHKFLDYRLRRATKLANLAGYSLTPLNNGGLELEIPGERQYPDKNESRVIFTQWSKIIPFKTLTDFVEVIELALENSVAQDVTFKSAFNKMITDADKIRENQWRDEVEKYVKQFGAEKLLAVLKGDDTNENEFPDLAQKS